VIEAFDQPWKTTEGSVGSYWGMFDASRHPKFSWTGAITNAEYWKIAAIAVAVGLLVSLPILSIAGATFGQAVLLAAAAHAVGAWAANLVRNIGTATTLCSAPASHSCSDCSCWCRSC